MLREVVGPNLRCPAGFRLELNPTKSFDEMLTTKVYKSSARAARRAPESVPAPPAAAAKLTPRGETYEAHTPYGNRTLDEMNHVYDVPSEYRCIGVERKLYNAQDWADIGSKCRPGYHLVNEFETTSNFYVPEKYYICEGSPVLPPEPTCPHGFKPSLNVYNSANFFGDQAISCSRSTRFKGRIWCPDTFNLQGEPAHGMAFGSEIEPTTGETAYDPYVYDTVSFTRDMPARCIRWLLISHDLCDNMKCRAPIVHEVSKIIKHFAYFAMKRDPDYINYLAIHGSNDRRWQPDGRQYPQR